MTLGVIILAAGQGTRMRSSLPKVLHDIAGKPMLAHVIETAASLNPAVTAVVYGHGGDEVMAAMSGYDVEWIHQEEQHGTGHAVQQAMPAMADVDRVLVLYGDVPLIRRETLQHLIDATDETAIGLLTAYCDDPSGYGRIVRDEFDHISRIVEHKDATNMELAIREVNVGIMVMDRVKLEGWLEGLDNDNAQGEYYLTDVIAAAVDEKLTVASAHPESIEEVAGVNDRVQLAALERAFQRRAAESLMREGLTLKDPARFDLRGSLQSGTDSVIDINVVIEGDVTLGSNVTIGANTVLKNCSIDDGVTVLENCVIEDAIIGKECRIGPFARIRPGTELRDVCHVGNFVELKNAKVDQGSKINHLSYVGDSVVGKGVNIGAGTITCNYDGANKHQTVIGDGAFIGSDTQLVAPVTVEAGATIGAGSTITRDAPKGKLTFSRVPQKTVSGWQRPVKEKK